MTHSPLYRFYRNSFNNLHALYMIVNTLKKKEMAWLHRCNRDEQGQFLRISPEFS